jgi:hypothetical protein
VIYVLLVSSLIDYQITLRYPITGHNWNDKEACVAYEKPKMSKAACTPTAEMFKSLVKSRKFGHVVAIPSTGMSTLADCLCTSLIYLRVRLASRRR